MTSAWSPSYEGWLSRATPVSDSFTPRKDSLLLASFVDTPAKQGVLTLALFKPNVAVTSSGQVLTLQERDLAAITSLAAQVSSLPETGAFRNQWRVSHPITSRPIHRMYIADGEGGLKVTSVYGYDKRARKLTGETAGYEELPDALYELFGLVEEGKKSSDAAGSQDVVDHVKVLIGDD
ncbi:hypothetical protein OE88DRAFT_1810272 [Heliocybe sulcata]|uniref:Uncharacterized protein n=1 Tax=Heliocybe sulcata TaxID=5364 RepID=A0A5C3MTR2_9AGAM|nr:hypothetical protein OE88DRAFT_1810272 [Heliocybe sulcata]